MSTAAPDKLMTIAEFHALPEDETVRRELLRGMLWEEPMTRRNQTHGRVEARIAQLLGNWVDEQPEPRGDVMSGETGCDLPIVGSSVGIDVAYYSAETLAEQNPSSSYTVGAPVLAVEIRSPSDTDERVASKILAYLDAGVAVVWEVNPRLETVAIHELDEPIQTVSRDDQLSVEPHLPGFSIPVRSLFER